MNRAKVATVAAALALSIAGTDSAVAFTCTPMNSNPQLANMTFKGPWVFAWNGFDCTLVLNQFGVIQSSACKSNQFPSVTPVVTGAFKVTAQCTVSGSFHVVASGQQTYNQTVSILRAQAQESPHSASIILGVAGFTPVRLEFSMIKAP